MLAEANFSEYMVEDAHVSKVSTFKAIQFNFVVRVISGHIRLRKKSVRFTPESRHPSRRLTLVPIGDQVRIRR